MVLGAWPGGDGGNGQLDSGALVVGILTPGASPSDLQNITHHCHNNILINKISLSSVPFSLWLSFSMDCSSLCSSREREVGAVCKENFLMLEI